MAKNQLGYLTDEQISILKAPIAEDLIEVLPDDNNNKYINHNVVTDILNRAFCHAWNWQIIDKGIEKTFAYVDKKGKEFPAGYYVWILGRLTYPVKDPATGSINWCYKEQFGGRMVVGNSKVQSQAYKSASSDALKKAASLLGIAPNVYMKKNIYETLEESDADAWTADKVQEMKEEITKMREIKSELGEEKFNNMVMKFCNETQDYSKVGCITPSNVGHFIHWYNSSLKSAPTNTKPASKYSIL